MRRLGRRTALAVLALLGLGAAALLAALALRTLQVRRPPAEPVKVVDPAGEVVGTLPPGATGESAGARPVRTKDGLTLRVPAGWRVDDAESPVGTALYGPGAKVWVYVQDLTGLPASAEEYVGYGNRAVLQQWSGLRLLLDQSSRVGRVPARVLSWSRPALRHVPGEDMNLYKEYNLIHGPKLVVTLQLKATAGAFEAAQATLHDLAATSRLEGPPPGTGSRPSGRAPGTAGAGAGPGADGAPGARTGAVGGGRRWEEWQTRDRLRWPLPERGLVWGLYDPLLEPDAWKLDEIKEFERSLGTRFGLLMTYQHFPDPFPARQMEEAARDGRLMMLTLQSWRPIPQAQVFTTPTTFVFEILRGDHDAYLRQYARDAAAWGRPFFFRLDNEMNADWSPWGAFHYGKDADLYVYAWRHVWRIFREEGATNALWVWNPNDTSFPNWKWNHHSRYWPGAEYVDWVGLTAYNLGNAYPDTVWREFRDAYRPVYDEYRRLYPGKPLMIAEFASHDGGGDKARWIADMFRSLREDFPEIRFAVWWNGTDGNRRYRLDSTPAAREAFAEGIQDPYFVNPVRFVP